MNYYLDLFTGITWNEFRAAGASTTGFREQNWKRAEKICPGDIFLCYMVGVKRWVGLLEVIGERFRDETKIWTEEIFPVRFNVKPLLMLECSLLAGSRHSCILLWNIAPLSLSYGCLTSKSIIELILPRISKWLRAYEC